MSYRVIYLDAALNDMAEIKDYLDKYSTEAWSKLVDKMERSVKSLEQFPNIGERYKNYRRLVCGDYLVFYQVNEEDKTVLVVRFLHGSLDIRSRL